MNWMGAACRMGVPVAAPWVSWGPLAISLACPPPPDHGLGMFPRDNAHTPQPSCLQPRPSFPLVTSGVHSPLTPPVESVCVRCGGAPGHLCPLGDAQRTGPTWERRAGSPGSQGRIFQGNPSGRGSPGLGAETLPVPRASVHLSGPGQSPPLLPSVGHCPRRGWTRNLTSGLSGTGGSHLRGRRGAGPFGAGRAPPPTVGGGSWILARARRDPQTAHARDPGSRGRARQGGSYGAGSLCPRLHCLLGDPPLLLGGGDD